MLLLILDFISAHLSIPSLILFSSQFLFFLHLVALKMDSLFIMR